MLDELKQEVLDCALAAERAGLCKHRSGNFSAYDTETGLVCITPTGMDREKMTYRDIIVMDRNAQTIEAETNLRPTSEALMHLAAYETRPDLPAVVHTHSKFATLFAVLKKPIPALVYEFMNLGCQDGFVPIADYARPGTKALADSVREPLRRADVVLLESHGVLAMGRNLEDALLKASYAEELAEIYYRALTVLPQGQEPPALPAEELKKWAYPKEIGI